MSNQHPDPCERIQFPPAGLIEGGRGQSVEALQLCSLLLPQPNRLRLHRLLRFISKASANPQLRLSKTRSNRSVLLEQIAPAILRRSGRVDCVERSDDVSTLVEFMVQNYQTILEVTICSM